GKLQMPFFYTVSGDKPAKGRSLYISLHGGGGAPKAVNDRQWENQKRLYRVKEGVYVAPRAPTNAWNLWHQGHIDGLFDRLIENLIVFEGVDSNRVYVLGYSAGGDGVYQLAPRMADRFAAAAMMAGHPNEASPLGLRNLAFTIHVGAKDSPYKRNQVARKWGDKLDALQKPDPEGYVHWTKIYAGKAHWLNREDAAALPWMAKHTRNPFPNRIVWRQDDVTHARFYWLAVKPEERRKGVEVRASLKGQQIDVQAGGISQLIIRVNDRMLNLDEDVTVSSQGKELYKGRIQRSIGTLAKTLAERGDPVSVFSGEVIVTLTGKTK
ncbi:polyhydroxyalkanoate depolymerase, partial [bacterium]|nr:polyhydroxyalkanoate depolymerase [bacterium]